MTTFLIRADSNGKIGTGHVMRMLGLGQYWLDMGGKVIFVSHCESCGLRQLIAESVIKLIDVETSSSNAEAMDLLLAEAGNAMSEDPDFFPWVVMDGYGFTAEDQKVVKDRGYLLLFVDDFGHASHYYADIVLNQNLSADESFYSSRERHTDLLLGVGYAVLRKEFRNLTGWKRVIPPMAKKILVTLGGADSDNVTERIILSLDRIGVPGIEARVLRGPANPHIDRLTTVAGSIRTPCKIVTQADMPAELKWADMAIVAGGTTCMEVAFLGLPAMTVVLADNQFEVARKLASRGVTVNLGWHHKLSEADLARQIKALILNADLRMNCSAAGQKLVDGHGVKRITRRIMAHSIRIRPVTAGDCELIWEWANDPQTRAASFNTEPIPLHEHVKWFTNRLNRTDVKFYVAVTNRGVPLGQARFEPDSGNTVISVLLAPAFRGRGLGSVLIDQVCRQFRHDSSVSTIKAYIKPENQSSRRAFTGAGFSEMGMTEKKGRQAVEMEYSMVA